MKSNCKSFFFFITISFGSGIIHPVRKIILEFERGKAAPRHQVDLKKSVALEHGQVVLGSGMMKRKIVEKLGMNEKKYALCLMLAGFAALNTGFTSQVGEIQSAETVAVAEVEQVPSEAAQIEEKTEIKDTSRDAGESAEAETPTEPAATEVATVLPVEEVAPEEKIEAIDDGIGYAAVMSMEASAYLPGDGNGAGITATGIPATYGVAAVDPSVIPLGTRLYIPGYGEAIAADTGGAIYGYRIDLCMESYSEAMRFGRRNVTVYVLDY